MKFEIVGDIENIETIAVGNSIRVLPILNKKYGKVVGGRKKEPQLLNYLMEAIGLPRFIGTMLTASVNEI